MQRTCPDTMSSITSNAQFCTSAAFHHEMVSSCRVNGENLVSVVICGNMEHANAQKKRHHSTSSRHPLHVAPHASATSRSRGSACNATSWSISNRLHQALLSSTHPRKGANTFFTRFCRAKGAHWMMTPPLTVQQRHIVGATCARVSRLDQPTYANMVQNTMFTIQGVRIRKTNQAV
jgi:hypothetical protein